MYITIAPCRLLASARLSRDLERRMRAAGLIATLVIATSLISSTPIGAQAQLGGPANDTPGTALDSLVARGLARSPAIRAASARIDAARARVGPAGARPDPMLMAGIQNLPISRPGFSNDQMTMKMIGASQTIPYPGKLTLRRAVSEHEVDAAGAAAAMVRRQVVRDVKDAYYELAFLDRALAIVEQSEQVLGTLIRTADARYAVGEGSQQEVLKARVEATRLAETATSLTAQRRATLAQLNAELDRPSDTPVARPTIPANIVGVAVGDSIHEPRFTSSALGAQIADSPWPPDVELEEMAVQHSPDIREQEAMIAAQATRVELARKAHLPDVDVSVQYGQRVGRPDMVSAVVSVPLPVQRREKQDQVIAEASALLAAMHEEHQVKVNEIRRDVARLVAELERNRTQLALYRRSILPQAQASRTSALASFQVSRVDFRTVLDDQATVFTYETEYYRALADFAKTLAELERVVGAEVIR
jgi:outer membrane protein, heavy metal efflux system